MSVDRGTLTRLSMQRLSRRFSRNKDYSKVDDINDTRVPLHNEDAFQHGLKFKAKFIGSLEIQRPQSKIDIISGMRRIRYEFKVKGVKKQRCVLNISTKGVRVTKRRGRRKKDISEEDLIMMQHPIYRIFYVSHDSQDLKIFSYITRESSGNAFQCNVFKAYKKRMALHVVRSLGQAFDVCHKQNPRQKKKKVVDKEKGEEKGAGSGGGKEETLGGVKEPHPVPQNVSVDDKDDIVSNGDNASSFPKSDKKESITTINGDSPLINFDPFAPLAPPPPSELQIVELDINTPPPQLSYVSRPRPKPSQPTIQENPLTASNDSIGNKNGLRSMSPSVSLGEPLTDITDGDVAKTQWEMEKQQIVGQMSVMKEQLQGETAARIEAQARVEHLLLQNKELLTHLQKLMVQLQQIQSFQLEQQNQQKKLTQNSNPQPELPIPDSNQTPPATEPEDTSSEQKTDQDTSHDSLSQSHDQPGSDSSPSKDTSESVLNQSEIDFNDAFKTSGNSSQLFDETNDPFKPLPDQVTPAFGKEILDAAFTPIATT